MPPQLRRASGQEQPDRLLDPGAILGMIALMDLVDGQRLVRRNPNIET